MGCDNFNVVMNDVGNCCIGEDGVEKVGFGWLYCGKC